MIPDPFSTVLGNARGAGGPRIDLVRDSASDRPPLVGDMAFACPACGASHYRHMTESPWVACWCGQRFNTNLVRFLGEVNKDFSLDATDADLPASNPEPSPAATIGH